MFCIHRNTLLACTSFVHVLIQTEISRWPLSFLLYEPRMTKSAYLQTEAWPNLSRNTCVQKSSPHQSHLSAPSEFTALTQACLELAKRSTVWAKYEACTVFQTTLSCAGDGRDNFWLLRNKEKHLKLHVSRLVGKASSASSLARMARSRPWSQRLIEVRSFLMLQINNVSSSN